MDPPVQVKSAVYVFSMGDPLRRLGGGGMGIL